MVGQATTMTDSKRAAVAASSHLTGIVRNWRGKVGGEIWQKGGIWRVKGFSMKEEKTESKSVLVETKI